MSEEESARQGMEEKIDQLHQNLDEFLTNNPDLSEALVAHLQSKCDELERKHVKSEIQHIFQNGNNYNQRRIQLVKNLKQVRREVRIPELRDKDEFFNTIPLCLKIGENESKIFVYDDRTKRQVEQRFKLNKRRASCYSPCLLNSDMFIFQEDKKITELENVIYLFEVCYPVNETDPAAGEYMCRYYVGQAKDFMARWREKDTCHLQKAFEFYNLVKTSKISDGLTGGMTYLCDCVIAYATIRGYKTKLFIIDQVTETEQIQFQEKIEKANEMIDQMHDGSLEELWQLKYDEYKENPMRESRTGEPEQIGFPSKEFVLYWQGNSNMKNKKRIKALDVLEKYWIVQFKCMTDGFNDLENIDAEEIEQLYKLFKYKPQ